MNTDTNPNLAAGAALWLDEAAIGILRQDLLRFARMQLRDPAAAEDVVQEALSAAYATREHFNGQAQVKTWVFSILRNKILDQIRFGVRHPTQSLTREDGSDEDVESQFDEHGYWHKERRPSRWGDPEETLANEQFWRILEICLHAMPENIARVFTMREMLDLETNEICEQLAISESNCWVILHRARSRLRLCLENNWVRSEQTSC
ncbi:MAG: sigma-70 family RNA polymerase sigma factor [Chromatiales bacterium]|nr:sigma-70 family RNA polymerase sigma factor [Gammaproteobacteria bacterium]MBW6475812.1 sigma-70 family RNA polymerase sigma factor [Chromatiales bacterium]